MQVIENYAPYKNRKGKKRKSQRQLLPVYMRLLSQVEDLGILSVEFDGDPTYKQRIEILKKIIQNYQK